jgi:hypothetical protein
MCVKPRKIKQRYVLSWVSAKNRYKEKGFKSQTVKKKANFLLKLIWQFSTKISTRQRMHLSDRGSPFLVRVRDGRVP